MAGVVASVAAARGGSDPSAVGKREALAPLVELRCVALCRSAGEESRRRGEDGA
jgi:hypothetical protein